MPNLSAAHLLLDCTFITHQSVSIAAVPQVMEINKMPLSSLSSVKINAVDYRLCLFPTADNVLLSEDGRDTFLCDFGHAERLDNQGQSLSGSKGKYCVILVIKLRRWVIYSPPCLNSLFSLCNSIQT